ncbi:hypothetical protein NPIL_577121 [Nephila pilipes]|uniref:Uncharacterized protein n=1 Tax=Nephila pilipes TaxID=299642 RepID=A0A8X6TND0_NEPPI|nr:hypothetical protein NPIL_577121 [Nephila pilipes]
MEISEIRVLMNWIGFKYHNLLALKLILSPDADEEGPLGQAILKEEADWKYPTRPRHSRLESTSSGCVKIGYRLCAVNLALSTYPIRWGIEVKLGANIIVMCRIFKRVSLLTDEYIENGMWSCVPSPMSEEAHEFDQHMTTLQAPQSLAA